MKKACTTMLIIIGIASIILGCVVFGMSCGYYESSKEYGGDAYTGIQQAAAQAANNTQDLAKIVKTGFGGIFILSGAVLIAVGANGPKEESTYTYASWKADQEKKDDIV